MSRDIESIITELQAQLARLHDENRLLLQRIAALEAENRKLRDDNDQLHDATRQAGRFRRPPGNKVPPEARKRPGRKPGHQGCYRQPPPQVDKEVELALPECPHCGSDVRDVQRIEQIIEEILPARAHAIRVVTYEGTCPHCGPVDTRHPWQTSRATGAAKVQLGPRALATATLLNKAYGLSMRKTCRVLEELCGLRLTPGGLSQALDRVAKKMEGTYENLIKRLRSSAAVFADETSWWVGEPGWWLWVFTTPEETVYRVDRSRGSKVVDEVLGEHFGGMLVSDCLSTYDPPPYRKHKCIAHHLRAITKARGSPGTTDPSYLDAWTHLFKAVLIAYKMRGELSDARFAEIRQELEKSRDRLLARDVSQPGDLSVQNRLVKQRDHLLGCLWEPAAEPTNNRAERSLRPAVIARKVSCGNRTERGRRTWEVLASLGATCTQRGQDFISYLAPRLALASPPR